MDPTRPIATRLESTNKAFSHHVWKHRDLDVESRRGYRSTAFAGVAPGARFLFPGCAGVQLKVNLKRGHERFLAGHLGSQVPAGTPPSRCRCQLWIHRLATRNPLGPLFLGGGGARCRNLGSPMAVARSVPWSRIGSRSPDPPEVATLPQERRSPHKYDAPHRGPRRLPWSRCRAPSPLVLVPATATRSCSQLVGPDRYHFALGNSRGPACAPQSEPKCGRR